MGFDLLSGSFVGVFFVLKSISCSLPSMLFIIIILPKNVFLLVVNVICDN